jgi:outer membrane lipoprotein-sorting protein
MEKNTGEGAGRLLLEFDASTWQLRRWVIKDALGITTTVTLQNPVFGEKLANRLFGVPTY